LGQVLYEDEARKLAEELPPVAAKPLLSDNRGLPLSVDEFFTRVAWADPSRSGDAIEHAEVVCRVLGEALPPPSLRRLVQIAPRLAGLFAHLELPPEAARGPMHEVATPRTLAEGRPGSRRPLSTANPSELLHHHSVARSNDPHSDTKLSSSRGLTQEREERTLAAGKPGSRRPLSEGR
jgi:hypothetical protein